MSQKNNLIKNTVINVASNFVGQDKKIIEKLDANLNRKYEKVELDENKYVELLKFNILFYKTLSRNVEPLISKWISDKYIPDIDELESSLEIITTKCRKYINRAMKEDIKLLKVNDLRSFIAYDKMSIKEKRRRLEKDYKVLNIYKDLLNILLRKISLDRDEFNELYDLDNTDVRRELKSEIIIYVNKIINDYRSNEDENNTLDNLEGVKDLNEDVDLEETDDIIDSKEDHFGLNDIEVTFLTKINSISREKLVDCMQCEYNKILSLEEINREKAYGFGKNSIAAFSVASVLLEFLNKKNKFLIESGFRLVVIGIFGDFDFKNYIKDIVKTETVISVGVWEESLKIISSKYEEIFTHDISKLDTQLSTKADITNYISMVKDCDSKTKFKDLFGYKKKEVLEESRNLCDNAEKSINNTDNHINDIDKSVNDTDKSDNNTVKQHNDQLNVFEINENLDNFKVENHIEENNKDNEATKKYDFNISYLKEEADKKLKKDKDTEKKLVDDSSEIDDLLDKIEKKDKVKNVQDLKEEDTLKEEKLEQVYQKNDTSKAKKLREMVIALIVVVVVVGVYVFTIGTRPAIVKNGEKAKINQKNTNTDKTNNSEDKESANQVAKESKEKADKEKADKEKADKENREKELAAVADGKGIYYRVYAGAVKKKSNAESQSKRYQEIGFDIKIVRSNGYYKLDAGDFDEYSQALQKSRNLQKKGITTFVSKCDKYYDYKLEDFKKMLQNSSKEDINVEYKKLKKELLNKSGSTYRVYYKDLKEIYNGIE